MNTDNRDPSQDKHFFDRGEQARLRPTSAAEQARAERRAAIRREPLPPHPQGSGLVERVK